MAEIAGISNLKENISKDINVLNHMCNSLSQKDINSQGYYVKDNILLGYKGLDSLDEQPVLHRNFVISFDGTLYNRNELGFSHSNLSDAQIVVECIEKSGYDVIKTFNGAFAFAIWNTKNNELVLARDHFGIKPIFYSFINDNLIFSSQIKAILAHPLIKTKIDSIGICELFGLGPAHAPANTVFKDIHELKSAHYLLFKDNTIILNKYWELQNKEHIEDFETTCDHVKSLLTNAIKRQIPNEPFCTFLSGGLDSSIITKYASNMIDGRINTFSVDYVDNDKNFVKSEFQPNSDNYYIDIMIKNAALKHHDIVIDTPELADTLEDAMVARNLPSMADVDSSLLLFCKNVKKDFNIALSGECADEVFGGYPWMFKENDLLTFPWSPHLDERQKVINSSLNINLKEYVDLKFKETLAEIPSDDDKKILTHLNLYWFGKTLIDRSERMGRYNNFDIRMPFADYELVEYVWNIPWEMKTKGNREKGLLRDIMKGILPDEIRERKKSPYPKTHNPNYLLKVKNMLLEIMNDSDAPIHALINREYVMNVINTDGKSFTKPWYGQLMTGPQFMAYLIQINMWLVKYDVKIDM